MPSIPANTLEPVIFPRRSVVGWDTNRLSMITAVLEARCQKSFSSDDIFLNIAGGLKISEPAADLAVAAALISAKTKYPASSNMIFFGEVGLSGEVRAVTHMETRLKEAEKLGFEKAVVPQKTQKKGGTLSHLTCQEIGHLQDLVDMFNG